MTIAVDPSEFKTPSLWNKIHSALSTTDMKRFWNWVLIWVVLTNIGFAALWFFGAPPRGHEILIAGFTGLLARKLSFALRYFAFVSVMTWSVLKFLGGLFNLTAASLFYSISFLAEIKPSDSIEYLFVAAALVVIFFVAYRMMSRDTDFKNLWLNIVAAISIFAVAGMDIYMGLDMRGHYFRSPPPGAEFSSAREESGFAATPDGRHMVMIMVESLGVPRGNPEMDRKTFGLYKNNPAITQRYEITQGTSPYYNSTTAGEVRELCGRWGDYYELVDKIDSSCLPATMAKKGYESHAMHSFKAPFFKRSTWYPNIGFQSQEFSKDLQAKGAGACDGVFPGACDRDVPKQISAHLKAAEKPQFLYWLTLNSHLPVPLAESLQVDNCETVSPYLAENYPMICRQFAIFDAVDSAIVKEITAKDFPKSDILIVGDHMPPYFDRHHRTQFDPEHVPWILLKAK